MARNLLFVLSCFLDLVQWERDVHELDCLVLGEFYDELLLRKAESKFLKQINTS